MPVESALLLWMTSPDLWTGLWVSADTLRRVTRVS